jgi:hypothetical protein
MKSKLARHKRRRNPSKATKLATQVGAGFAGYLAARLAGRIAYSQAVKRSMKASKHMGAVGAIAGAAGVYYASRYWDKAKPHHDELVMGAAIAAAQTVAQTYLPERLKWITQDWQESEYASVAPKEDEAALPEIGDFDLDQLLSENPDVEAVEVGRAAPLALPGDPGGGMGDYDDIENYNGMLN